MKIAIALPCSGRYPIGGFRIVYEHANRLALSGHSVTVFHATNIDYNKSSFIKRLKSLLLFLRNKYTGMYRPTAWFKLDSRVKTECSMSIRIPSARSFDVAIATAWQTAAPISRSNAKRKYYFIQHFEDWDNDATSVIESWKLPLVKIAISQWLRQLIEKYGDVCHLVPNAIDADFFHPKSPIEDRDPRSVLIQLHPKEWKGSADALEAVKILRSQGDEIELVLFGIPDDRDFAIDGPYRYVRNPSQDMLRDLYGTAAIFVAASWTEGWGLTPHEASACGAAVVATDINGHREFLEHNVSALLSPPKDAQALARHIKQFLDNETLRCRIAHAGCVTANRFTWKNTSKLFEAILTDS